MLLAFIHDHTGLSVRTLLSVITAFPPWAVGLSNKLSRRKAISLNGRCIKFKQNDLSFPDQLEN